MHNIEQCFGCVAGGGDRSMGRTLLLGIHFMQTIVEFVNMCCLFVLVVGSPSSQFKSWHALMKGNILAAVPTPFASFPK